MKRKIEKIYELLSRIPVNGDFVDVMAAVRADLRIVHNQLIQQEKEKESAPKIDGSTIRTGEKDWEPKEEETNA